MKKDTQLASPEAVARACGESTRTVVTPEGWKLNLRDTGEHELYNLRSDPLELHNVVHTEEARPIREILTTQIKSWQERTADRIAL